MKMRVIGSRTMDRRGNKATEKIFRDGSKVRVLISIIGFEFIAVCFFLMCRYRFPVGDDVLSQFEDTIYFYLDDYNVSQLEFIPIKSLNQIFNYVVQLYFLWSGRLLEPVLQPALGILGRNFTAIISVCIYMGAVLLAGRLICNNIKTVFHHPCMVIVLSSLVCLYNFALELLIMWTMSIIYGYSLLMYLLMMNVTKDMVYGNKKYNILFVNIVGFMAGISHELIGAWFISQLMFVIFLKNKFNNFLWLIKYYVGLIIGYLICFFAPGNFNRMHQKHDAGMWDPYWHKLLSSFQTHLGMLLNFEGFGKFIFVFTIISALVAFGIIIKKHKKKTAIKKVIFFTVNIITSIFFWSLVSCTPNYGVIGALIYLILAFFVLINEIDCNKIFTVIVMFVLFGVLADNAVFMNQFVRESLVRETRVREGIEKRETEVHVDAYSSNLNRNFLLKSYVDNNKQFSEPYYIKFYGIRIIIDEN